MVRTVGSETIPTIQTMGVVGRLLCDPVPQFPHLSSGMLGIYLVKAQKSVGFYY